MSAPGHVRPRVWGALALAGLFLLLGVGGYSLRRDRERLARVFSQERELRGLAQAVQTEQAWLMRQLTRPLDDPRGLIETYAAGTRVTVRGAEEEMLSDAIRLRRVALELDGVSWKELSAILEAFETQNPPWRLQEIDLRSGLAGLEGRLRFEGLEAAE